ncbi:MAG: FG-GAP-like repeat-containing protein [Thermoanaerobaculia bacterium]
MMTRSLQIAAPARTAIVGLALVFLGTNLGAALEIVFVSPEPRSLTASLDSRIRIEFDRPVDRQTLTPASFWAFGRWSGAADGALRVSRDGRVVTLTPARRFSAGESVMVILSRDLRGADGSPLRAAGFSYQFWTRTRGSGFDLAEIDRFSTRSDPEATTRTYGGFGSDLNGDGFLDLTVVNEDTNDLRIFLNRGDYTGTFAGFEEPTTPVGNVPSPSEPSDFNRDGLVDVAVANTQDETVSVLLGNGDGTFAPARSVFVGGEPRGITVLDADGDGDTDIAATSFELGRVTVLENDGAGDFTEGFFFGSGGDNGGGGERAIAAADMNSDGLLDLVVGLLTAQEIQIWTNDGAGSFTLNATQASGGEVWMVMIGDLDGNGTEDVATVNSRTDNGAILMGDGEGGLEAPRMTSTDPFPLATDLADLDGDGDLDWVTSSFFGNWLLFENDGSGSFALERSIAAPQAASCSLPMDLDNDGVLDLVLIDELEDEVVLMRSRATILDAGFESGDFSGWSKAKGSLTVVGHGLGGTGHALEVGVDGRRAFVETRRPNRESSLSLTLLMNPSSLELGDQSIEILRLGGGKATATMTLERSGSRYRLRLFARDADGFREIGATRIRGDRTSRIGVEWSSASGRDLPDGRAALLRKGKVRAEALDLANHGEIVRRLRIGLLSGSETAAGGSFLIDEVLATR